MELKSKIPFIAVLYTVILTVLSLANVSNNVINMQSNRDKMFHAGAYAILTIVWFLTFYKTLKYSKIKSMSLSAVLSISFGILLEVLQGQLTSYRFPDYKDAIANTFGVIVMIIIIGVKYKSVVKK